MVHAGSHCGLCLKKRLSVTVNNIIYIVVKSGRRITQQGAQGLSKPKNFSVAMAGADTILEFCEF